MSGESEPLLLLKDEAARNGLKDTALVGNNHTAGVEQTGVQLSCFVSLTVCAEAHSLGTKMIEKHHEYSRN